MSQPISTVVARAVRGITRRGKELRNIVEWRAAHALRREAPWSRNRWGQKYQSVSLSEYHYLRDGNPDEHASALTEWMIRPGMVVVDIGANHGMFSLEAAHLIAPGGFVHAFEPTPSTRAVLLKNLSANDLTTVKVFSSAVGSEPGTARLRVHRELSGLNTLADRDITWNHRVLPADEVIEVPVTTLDAHAEAEGLSTIDFVKVDVEGLELDVIRGARNLLQARRIERMLLEVGDVTCANAAIEPDEIVAELRALGYELHTVTPEGQLGPVVDRFPTTTFSANFLALPAER